MKRAWGNNTDRVLLALQERGPLAEVQLCWLFNEISQAQMSVILKRLRESTPKRAHIQRWVNGIAGPTRQSYLRAVHAIGDWPDAPKPPGIKHTMSRGQMRRLRQTRCNAVVSPQSQHVLLAPPRNPA